MLWRIGEYLLFIGLIVLIVFFITDQVDAPNYWFFCSGVLIVLIGAFYMWHGRIPPEKAERFRMFRRMKEKQKKK
jgi:hypothetical protein